MTAQLAEPEAADEPHAATAPGTRPPMVLHVRVVTGHGGGPEKTILNSPRYLAKLGYQSKLAYLHPPDDPGIGQLQNRGRALNAEVISVPDRGPFDLGVIRRLIRICRDEQVAIWHGHDYKSNLLGLLIRPFVPMQLVTTIHGWGVLTGRMPLYNKIDKWCLKYYRAVICVTEDMLAECDRWRVPPQRRYVVHNAIDLDSYRPTVDRREAKRALGLLSDGLSSDGLLVGAVGRLSPEKGFDLLIGAIVQLRQEGIPISLAIAGDGPQRQALEQQIRAAGCADYVRLLGHVSDPLRVYEAMDIYALSSHSEGLPNVVLEAMAMEVPVVATSITSVPMLLDDGRCGVMVEPGSASALAAGLRRLAADPALRQAIAASARARLQERFSFDQRMKKIVRIYNEVLQRR
jgi:glycosyltransferase involved in cell wall biosynthesis